VKRSFFIRVSDIWIASIRVCHAVWFHRFSLAVTSGISILASGISFAVLDINNNGLSDLWEKQYNGGELFDVTFDPQADPDADGWSNEQEAAAGTNPNDPNPPVGLIRPVTAHFPAVIDGENGIPVVISPEVVTVTWPTLVGKQYTLWFTPDLTEGSWFPVGEPFIASDDVNTYYFHEVNITDRRFWRVAVQDVDTDDDSLTNAEEQELGTNSESNDTDGDGLADADEVRGNSSPLLADTDADGVHDKTDVLTEPSKIFNWEKEEPVLYAAFPASPPGTVLQVNDQGFILTSGGVWKNGTFSPLAASNETLLRNCQPLSIGDNGFVLGMGEIDLPDDDGEHHSPCLVTWQATPPGTDLIPQPLLSGQYHVHPVFLDYDGLPPNAIPLPPSDLMVNRHGHFVAHRAETKTITANNETLKYLFPLMNNDAPISSLFESTAGSAATPRLSDVPDRSVFAVDEAKIVVMRADRRLELDGHVFPPKYNRIVRFDDTRLIAATGYNSAASFSIPDTEHPLVLSNNNWVICDNMRWTTDYSNELRIATQHFWRLYHNGWSFEGFEMFPNQNPDWQTVENKRFYDITPHGITLQMRKDGDDLSTMMGIPIRLRTDGHAIGVDNLSVTGSESSWATPIMLAGNKKEFWIMVPAGGSLTFDLESAASSHTPLSVDSAGGFTFAPASVSSGTVAMTVSASENLAGQEHDVDLKIGNVSNATVPLKIKVMKRRNVSVSVYPLRRPSHAGVVPTLPTQPEIENYIDGIFKPQIGVDFAVTVHPVSEMTNDPGPIFDVKAPPYAHQEDIAATRLVGKIRIFVMLDHDDLWADGGGFYSGYSNPDSNYAWIGVKRLKEGTPEGVQRWLHTFAHESGHILIGAGHPDVDNAPGPACLPLSNQSIRLMYSGFLCSNPVSIRRWIVKAEWDVADHNLKELLEEED
jgi:hypothetical protein